MAEREIKQSTSFTARIGPFLDETDGKSVENALNIQPGDIRLSKNGAAFAAKTNADTCDADTLGYYSCVFSDTDAGTLGDLHYAVHESGALPVFGHFAVVKANYWDTKYSTDYLHVDVMQVKGDDADTAIATPASIAAAVGDTIQVMIDALADVTGDSIQSMLDALNNLSGDSVQSMLDAQNDVSGDSIQTMLDALSDLTGDSVQAMLDALSLEGATGDSIQTMLDALNDVSGDSIQTMLDALSVTATIGDTAVESIVDALAGDTVEAGATFYQEIRGIAAATMGKSSGGGTETNNFRDLADSKNRIVATVDEDGNRTAVTRTLT